MRTESTPVSINDIIVSTLLFIVSAVGLTCGSLAAFGYYRQRRLLNQAFCYFMISAAVYDNCFFVATLFWSAPLTVMLNAQPPQNPNVQNVVECSGGEIERVLTESTTTMMGAASYSSPEDNPRINFQLAAAVQQTTTTSPKSFPNPCQTTHEDQNSFSNNQNQTLTNQTFHLTDGFWGHRIGQLANTGWFGSCFHLLMIAFNRLCAVASPFRYKEWFSPGNAKVILLSLNLFILAFTFYLFLDTFGCGFLYHQEDYAWRYQEGMCSDIWYDYIGRTASTILPAATLSLIAATLVLMIRQGQRSMLPARNSSKRRELYMFLISSLNVCIYLTTQGFWVISSRFPGLSRLGKFFTRHLIWVACHTSNGLLTLAIMRQIRYTLRDCLLCRPTSSNNYSNSSSRRNTRGSSEVSLRNSVARTPGGNSSATQHEDLIGKKSTTLASRSSKLSFSFGEASRNSTAVTSCC